jgi:enoyl-CoA hydratase
MSYENVKLRIEDGVAVLSVEREGQRNCLSAATIRDLRNALGAVRSDDSARALILTGAGSKAFCAGADIGEVASVGLKGGQGFLAEGHALNRDLESLAIPTLAAVNGLAVGGGCELAMACTLRIAAKTALFGLPELGLGVIPGFGGTQRLPRLVGKSWALWYLLTGEMLDAAKALELGLVHRVVEPEELLPDCLKVARKIASKAPLAVRAALLAVNHGLGADLETGLALEAALANVTLGSRDKQEGIAAFFEKRAPAYKGE